MFRLPPTARSVTPLSIEGIRGRLSPVPTPHTNLVGVSGPGVRVPDASIDAAIEYFRSEGVPFGWLIGPNSEAGLVERLEARGLILAEEFSGLVRTDLSAEIPVPDSVTVRELGPEDEAQFVSLLARAFGLPAEMISFLCEVIYFADSEHRARNYFAYVDGVDEPIGTGSSLCDPNDPIVILAGSAVLEEHRGKGAYRALVRRRFEDAKHEGLEAAAIQAVRSTSAPICSSLGFEEVCAQSLYTWSPS